MKLSDLVLSGTGVFVPPQTITNEEIVASFNAYVHRHNQENASAIADGLMTPLLESSSAFIVKASGIKTRHVLDKAGILDPDILCPRLPERPDGELSIMAEISIDAAKKALAAAGKQPGDIDAVIVSCSNLPRAYPALAIEIQGALGITGFAFDMVVGCASATYGTHVARGLIEGCGARAVLICSPEIVTAHANFRERDSHFLFGDAATAMVIERKQTATADHLWEIVSTKAKAEFSNNIRNNFGFLNRCDPPTAHTKDKLFVQHGRKVFKEVLPLVSDFIDEHLEDNGLNYHDVRRLWLHQANINMNHFVSKKVFGHDASEDEAPNIIGEIGNVSSAGAVIAFNRHSADLKPGDIGVLCTFGAGYSAGSVILKKLS